MKCVRKLSYLSCSSKKIYTMVKKDTLAAIDIGSNAIRLVISDVEQHPGETKFKRVGFIRVPIRLGEDVFTQGFIGEQKLALLKNAMMGFSHTMKAFQVSAFRACATSAMREAANGAEVVESIMNDAGIPIEIISGQLEADTIFAAGGLDSVLDSGGSFLYVDVGGGSTEIVVYCDGKKQESKSFRLGTVRMLSGAVDKEDEAKFKKWLKEIAKKYQAQCIIGSGGNINKVQRLLGKKEKEPISALELNILYRTLKPMSYEQRVHDLQMKTYRADVIIPALKIFVTVSKICDIDQVVVPRLGLADGIIKELSLLNDK